MLSYLVILLTFNSTNFQLILKNGISKSKVTFSLSGNTKFIDLSSFKAGLHNYKLVDLYGITCEKQRFVNKPQSNEEKNSLSKS